MVCKAAKDLHFNKNMEALKRMQAGVDKLSTVVGVTIGPKVGRAIGGIAWGCVGRALSQKSSTVPTWTCKSNSQ